MRGDLIPPYKCFYPRKLHSFTLVVWSEVKKFKDYNWAHKNNELPYFK
jgi:hypothetical protein